MLNNTDEVECEPLSSRPLHLRSGSACALLAKPIQEQILYDDETEVESSQDDEE